MKRAVIILLALGYVSAAHAQSPGVRMEVGARSLEVGEAVDVKLICTNTGVPSQPQTNLPEGLDLQLLTAEPSFQSRTSIINGRRTQKTTYTYRMRLVGKKPGRYTLGPISVEIDGKKHDTGAIAIRVKKTNAKSTPPGDRIMSAELRVDPSSVYVTENFYATLTITIRKVIIKGKTYELDLPKYLDRRSQLSVFAGQRYSVQQLQLTDSSGNRHSYVAYRLRKQIRAEQVGESVIGPVFLSMKYPTEVRPGFWGKVEVSRARRETARARAVRVEVKTPPAGGRPASYAGAIGRYKLKVDAKPRQVEQNQPITLAISLTGSSIAGVAAPDLARNAELASRFDFAKDELVGELEGAAKVFRRAIFPKLRGEQTIPPITWSYFDPGTEKYVVLTSDPIAITVNPPSASSTTIRLAPDEDSSPTESTLTLLSGGLSPNYVSPKKVLADRTYELTRSWIAALFLPPVVYVVLMMATRHRTRLKFDPAFARRRRALRKATSLIAGAQSNGEPGRRLDGLAAALTTYLADRFNLPPGTLTSVEARALLAEHAAGSEVAHDVAVFLESCEAARYSPNEIGTMPADRAAKQVRTLIKQIERNAR